MAAKKPAVGTLYIVATPIGNPGDWTDRAKVLLAKVDVVAAEDTRVLKRELARIKIKPKRVISCHGHNENESAKGIIELLLKGLSVAVTTDAGTPLISDPGAGIILAARKNNIAIVPLPGVSSLTTALSVSGFGAPFFFGGFLPAKTEERQKVLRSSKARGDNLVFFEVPHRLRESLADAETVLGGDVETVVCRELTKPYEEIINQSLKDIRHHFARHEPRGEFVILFRGSPPEMLSVSDTENEIRKLLEKGNTASQILEHLQPISEMSRRQIYDTISRLKHKEIV